MSHETLAAVLIAVAFLVGLADLWLPQLPTLLTDGMERSAWLAQAASQYRGGALLQTLGAFDLRGNPSLRVLLPLLAITLCLRLIDRVHLAWKTRRLAWPDHNLPTLVTREFSSSGEEPWAAWFTRHFARWQHAQANDNASEAQAAEQGSAVQRWWGDRNHRWVGIMGLVEAGWLLALLALLLNLRTGWQMEGLSLDAGGAVSLAPFSQLSVNLDATAQNLRLCCQPERSAPLAAGVLRAGPVQARVQELGAALRLTASAAGQSLILQAVEQVGNPASELLLHFPQERSERAVALPERQLFLRMVTLGQDRFRVQALDASDQLLLSQEIAGPTTLTIDGVEVTLSPTRFVTLHARSRPGLALLLPAVGLLLAGWLALWRFPYARAGVISASGGAVLRWQGQSRAHRHLAELFPPTP